MKYNKKADKYLKELYDAANAKTYVQKFLVLVSILGSCSFTHNPSYKQKVAMMEYELLEEKKLITLVTA